MEEITIQVDSEKCQSCGINFQGDFCHACGQKRIHERFKLKESTKWVYQEIFNIDHGFLFTTKEIILRPHILIKEYLSGATKKYMHPFRFLFIWATINSLLVIQFGVFDGPEIFKELKIDMDKKAIEEALESLTVVKKYMTFIMILGVPFMSLASFWVFKKKKLYYTEHLILNSFAYAGSIILGLPLVILFFFPHGIFYQGYINTFVYLFYFAFVFTKLFKDNFIKSTLKVLLVSIVAFIIALIFGFLLGIIAVIIKINFFKS